MVAFFEEKGRIFWVGGRVRRFKKIWVQSSIDNFKFSMSCIETKSLKNLLKMVEKRPNYSETVTNFNVRFFFRTTVKLSDFDNLVSIAEKINRRYKRNG